MRTRQATTPPAPLVASGDADVKVGAGTKPPTNPDDGAPVTAVPATYQRPGQPPTNPATCKVCGLDYVAHTGRTCALCGAPVEHHGQPLGGPGPYLDFTQCHAGARRMAEARRGADVTLTDTDRAVLVETPA